MKSISVLIKPASSLCNLRCKYCFYANVSSLREVRSYGKMKSDIATAMMENIFKDLDNGDHLTLAFQGGEPTVAGLSFFENIVELVNKQEKAVDIQYAIQTNGTLIDQRWCEFLKKNHFLVGLSIDGNPIIHDLNRVDTHGRGTFHKVMKTKHLFDSYDIDYNILCVLTNTLAKEAQQVFHFLKEEKIDFVQFIPCLDDLETTDQSTLALTPAHFANFYITLLNFWIAELHKGHYISIKLFDDIANLLAHRQTTACGILGACQVQYVIEADGSVYPCDFYVLDKYRLGYIQETTLQELFYHPTTQQFLCSRGSLPERCHSCEFYQICRGGCKRMKDAMYVDEKTNFCGYAQVLHEFIPRIETALTLVEKIRTSV